ncbi:PIN domain-containing protein [Candidatus Saccharibacteria bacterium]|nr:MAG: PIN domain-containing protein [Candidatus Saccharibacteria bacterium]
MVVDTNIILRFLLDDDSDGKAELVLRKQHVTVTDMVISEVLYVLTGKQYRHEKVLAVEAITALLRLPNITHQSDIGENYLHLYAVSGLDVTDCYLVCFCVQTKKTLMTFDKTMKRVYEQELSKLHGCF